MNIVLTMALGSRTWGDFALNLCLSIKSVSPKAKVGLIHDGAAILGLESEVERFFDFSYRLQDSVFTTAYEHAFYTKTCLYDIGLAIANTGGLDRFIYLDADVIMLPGRSVDEWFDKLEWTGFTAWNNGYYDYGTKQRMGRGYTFWCEPEETRAYVSEIAYWGIRWTDPGTRVFNQLPQINSSFLYWEAGDKAKLLFTWAKKVWNDNNPEFKYNKYKGVKPDELCFNIASAIVQQPHQAPYYPIFFQFASENHEETYIQHGWQALGFAGEGRQSEHLCYMYNKYVAYYRDIFGVDAEFKFDNTIKAISDTNPLRIEPVRQRTLYRRGEVPGSLGGVFNPDGIVLPPSPLKGELKTSSEKRITIFRKEANHNMVQGYVNETAVPWVHVLSADGEEEYELKLVGFEPGVRVEDFRLFMCGDVVCCSHTLIKGNLKENMDAKIAVSEIRGNELVFIELPKLPVDIKKVEKNWVFFADENMYCIYSLNPYKIFECDANGWWEMNVKQPELKWFHYGQFICNSTNPILIQGGHAGAAPTSKHWLMFFHTKQNGIYHHGAVLIDPVTKEITHYTRNSIPIKRPDLTEGIAKGIVYLSGNVYLERENNVRVFFGEADCSACCVDFNKDELLNLILRYPVTP